MFGLGASTLISVAAAVLLTAAPAHATPVSYSSGFATPATTLDFSGLTDGTISPSR
jgi:hypothetical protein